MIRPFSEHEINMLFDEGQIKRRVKANSCLICGVEWAADPTGPCDLQPLDIPAGTRLLSPHLWPSVSAEDLA